MCAEISKFLLEDFGSVFISRSPEDRFIWTLPNCFQFCHSYTSDDSSLRIISSPCFSAFHTKWRLALIRNDYDWNASMGLFLWKVSLEAFTPQLTVKLGLMASDEDDELQIEGEVNSYGCFGRWGFHSRDDLIESSEIFISDGRLKYFCEMRLMTVSTPTSSNEKLSIAESIVGKMSLSKGANRLVQDLNSLLLDGHFSDLVLKVGDCEFKVHRNILIARSPVFALILQPGTKENITGVVDIRDCSADIFDILLTYVYTGKAMSYENVFDLYYAADKYQIIDLQSECVEHMAKNLSVENFCNIMMLSYMHSDLCLEKKATNFFLENIKVILKTDQWLEYIQNYPVQANDLYMKAMNA